MQLPPDVERDEPRVLEGEVYSMVTHSDDHYDPENISFPGARRLYEYAKSQGIPHLLFEGRFAGGNKKSLSISPREASMKVESWGGEHELKFPNARMFLFGGGYLELCLCDTVSDVLRGLNSSPEARPVSIVLVSDAIYVVADGAKPGLLSDQAKTDQDFLNQLPSFSENRLKSIPGGKYRGWYCAQMLSSHDTLRGDDFRFEIFRGDRRIAAYGDHGRTVRIIFAKSSELSGITAAREIGSQGEDKPGTPAFIDEPVRGTSLAY